MNGYDSALQGAFIKLAEGKLWRDLWQKYEWPASELLAKVLKIFPSIPLGCDEGEVDPCPPLCGISFFGGTGPVATSESPINFAQTPINSF